MFLADLFGLHPLVLTPAVALFSLIWGLQATVGANLGYRRGLEWQTGFLLGLVVGGVLVAFLYSVRPWSIASPIEAPKWVRTLSIWPSALTLGASIALAVLMEILSSSVPVVAVNAPWEFFYFLGIVFSLLALISFTALGAYLGRLWYDQFASQRVETENATS